jgi:hypothetical protein
MRKKGENSSKCAGKSALPPDENNGFTIDREKGKPCEKPGGESASAECYCTKLKSVCKLLIINKIVVEATGVELITMLTVRKLLIPGRATRAKTASLPIPLYVYCTKMLFAPEPADTS